MGGDAAGAPRFGGVRRGARQAVKRSGEDLVRTGSVTDGRLPLLVEPAVEGVNLASWGEAHRDWILDRLFAHGGVLFRGFAVGSVERFEEVVQAVTGELLDYRERAAPRHEVGRKVYTSTEFPADQWIPLHHEMSYSHNWPAKLWFYCVEPPARGGRTPLVDDRALYGRIDPEVKRRFLERKVMYVRNYGEGLDLPWQVAFQTDDRAAVEAYCRAAGTTVEWRDGDRLRTRAVRQVVATHPATGDTVWFNHAHMFHSSNLGAEVRQALRAQFAEDELPRNAFYGDGGVIEDEVLAGIRDLYRRESVAFEWRRDDVLLLDNFLSSHGREPFEGPRKIVVSMADLYTDPTVAASGA